MASFFYVIVPASVAKQLGLETVRQQLPGGCYLLTQKDFSTQKGSTLYQRVAPFGGIPVSEAEALQIIAGVIEPPIQEPEETPEEISPDPEVSEEETESQNE